MGILSILNISFLFLISWISIQKTFSNPTKKNLNSKIVIIGAGASGIAAGVKLLDYGFEDITILEAESRIGGRIHTIPFGKNVIDLGAQWCHGENNNIVYDLVKDQDLFDSTMDTIKNSTYCRSTGEIVPKEISNRLNDIIEKITFKRFNSTILNYNSFYDYAKKEYYKYLKFPEYNDIDNTIAAEFFDLSEKEECSAEGSDNLKETPVRGIYEYSGGDQALNWKDKGYITLLKILMKTEEIGMEYGVLQNRIKLSKKVQRLNWKQDDSRIKIECENGEEIIADHVILTVSIGVLKDQYRTLFNPPLPIEKQTAIEAISFGSVNKIFLEFDKKFWPDYWTGFMLLWTEDDLKEIRDTDDFWFENLFGIFAVDYQPFVFEAWLIGSSARHIETLSNERIKADCIKIFKRFLQWEIPEPINIISTNWGTNPNFKGSWSYHKIKMLESGITPRDLERPINVTLLDCNKIKQTNYENHCDKPIVQFAGEASSFKHFSTVHGAVETGWREAKRLAEYYEAEI